MKIRYLKWALIVLLVLVNIYLGLSIYLQYRDLAVVGREEQELVSALLAKDGIAVSPDVIPDRKPSGEIYEYEFLSDSYCEETAGRFFGQLANMRQMPEPNLVTHVYREGVKVTVLSSGSQSASAMDGAAGGPGGGIADGSMQAASPVPVPSDGNEESMGAPESLYFSVGTEDMLGFEYRIADGDGQAAAYVLDLVALFGEVDLFGEALDFSRAISDDKKTEGALSGAVSAESLRITDGRYHRSLTEDAKALLDEAMNGSEKGGLYTEATGVVEDSSNGYITVTLGCRLDGRVVHGAGAVLVFDSSEQLIYAGGRLLFGRAGRSYQSALRDQVNILFDERGRHQAVEEEQQGSGSGDGHISDTPESSYTGDGSVVFPWWYDETEQVLPGAEDDPKPPVSTPEPAETEPAEDGRKDDGKDLTVTKMSVIYCINWNDVQTKCYLIPAWKIDYADGSTYIRNAINGDLHR